jgi:hypothetical protein
MCVCVCMWVVTIALSKMLQQVMCATWRLSTQAPLKQKESLGSGPCPSSGILITRKHNVSETGSVCVSGEGGRHILSWVPYKKLTSITVFTESLNSLNPWRCSGEGREAHTQFSPYKKLTSITVFTESLNPLNPWRCSGEGRETPTQLGPL